LKIGFAAGLSAAPALRILEGREPGLAVDLEQVEWSEQTEVLLDGRVDIALVRPPLDAHGLVIVPLFREPRLSMLPADHRFAHATVLRIEQLAGDPVIRHAGASDAWEAFSTVDPRPDGRSPQRGPTVRKATEKLEQIAAGRGIAFAPASAASSFVHPGVVYVPVDDIPPAEVAVAYREGNASSLTTAFVDAALEAVPAYAVPELRGVTA
jgi:DNA-binding transcriptional LysR family regulator